MTVLEVTRSDIIVERCRRSFLAFLPHWRFINRETGATLGFGSLWEGQQQFAELMTRESWIYALKAGKLGFTELECAWDAWCALFRHPYARVHLFSKDQDASRNLSQIVRFGLEHLPADWGLQFLEGRAGDNTAKSFRVRARFMSDPEDFRTIVSYPAVKNVAIDQSATHNHVDELSHMQYAEALWNSISTTIPVGGSCHVLTRGAGDAVYSAELWEAAKAGESDLVPFFADWSKRPDRSWEYREQMAGKLTPQGLGYFLPETEEDALAGDESSPYIPLEVWDRLHDTALEPMRPGSEEPSIIILDAGTSHDFFGGMITTRHPVHHERAAIRACRAWRPQDFEPDQNGVQHVDYDVPERWVRFVVWGGCVHGHPRNMPLPGCELCDKGDFPVPGSNVIQVCYDEHQLENMAQHLKAAGIWCQPFPQGEERLIADAQLYTLALNGDLAHNGDPVLREHIGNCRAKVQSDEESKLRICKKGPARKIDLAVCASMGTRRILRLNL